jgi:hypothetical protein
VSQVTLARNRSLGDRLALSRPCGRGSTLRALPRAMNVVLHGLTNAISVSIQVDLLQRPACIPSYEVRRP